MGSGLKTTAGSAFGTTDVGVTAGVMVALLSDVSSRTL